MRGYKAFKNSARNAAIATSGSPFALCNFNDSQIEQLKRYNLPIISCTQTSPSRRHHCLRHPYNDFREVYLYYLRSLEEAQDRDSLS